MFALGYNNAGANITGTDSSGFKFFDTTTAPQLGNLATNNNGVAQDGYLIGYFGNPGGLTSVTFAFSVAVTGYALYAEFAGCPAAQPDPNIESPVGGFGLSATAASGGTSLAVPAGAFAPAYPLTLWVATWNVDPAKGTLTWTPTAPLTKIVSAAPSTAVQGVLAWAEVTDGTTPTLSMAWSHSSNSPGALGLAAAIAEDIAPVAYYEHDPMSDARFATTLRM